MANWRISSPNFLDQPAFRSASRSLRYAVRARIWTRGFSSRTRRIDSSAARIPDTVKITLASAPTGQNKRLRYAYTATPLTCPGTESGPRGNLRDSDTTPSRYGYALHDWCVHFDEAVP